MKITRYPQSCLVVQHDSTKLVIDPGINFLESHTFAEIADVDAVLYTHQHKDHYDPAIAEQFLAQNTPLYCNQATAELVGKGAVVVTDGEAFTIGPMQVVARELPHMTLADGAEGPQNTGYIINGMFFHPGDGKDIDSLAVTVLALPITGPDISPKEAFDFAKKVSAQKVIPIHFDVLGANPLSYQRYAKGCNMPFEMIILADGESVEL